MNLKHQMKLSDKAFKFRQITNNITMQSARLIDEIEKMDTPAGVKFRILDEIADEIKNLEIKAAEAARLIDEAAIKYINKKR